MNNEFLKKEIEEVEKEIENITGDMYNTTSALDKRYYAGYLKGLSSELQTLKECQEKHNKFVEKLKEEIENIDIENYIGEFSFKANSLKKDIINKISSEEIEG